MNDSWQARSRREQLALGVAGLFVAAVLAWVLYKFVVTGDTDLMDDIKEMG